VHKAAFDGAFVPPQLRCTQVGMSRQNRKVTNKMPKRLLRLKAAFDKATGRLPVGQSEAYLKYLHRSDDDPFVPNTSVRRLKLVDIGPKARAVDEADLDRLINELADIPHKPWIVRDHEPSRPRARPRARRSTQAGATS
jgi:hypothetical protein